MLSFEQFDELAKKYDKIPVARALLSDGLTPVQALHRMDQGGHACLFESVVGGEKVGRYSFLGFDPKAMVIAKGNEVTFRQFGSGGGETVTTEQLDDPLDFLRRHLFKHTVAKCPDLPPLTGGAIGYMSYDVVRYAEHLPNVPEDDRDLPDMAFGFFDELVVFDHAFKTVSLIALATPSNHASTKEAYLDAKQRIRTLAQRLKPTGKELANRLADFDQSAELDFRSNFSKEEFKRAVEKCVEYIKAGDIFQVVLSQRFEAKVRCNPLEIYRTLRVLNPSPFMFFMRTEGATLVGGSPEIMCRSVDGKATVRPLAGTRPRGKTEAEDLALEKELHADPKECAEHTMLVDLGRNDLGKVAKVGSIELPEIMITERYSHVMHLSSTVDGELRDDCDALDALAATLPAGTVSGAPKVRAMEIIDELETKKRGPYAGAVGYLDYNGNMDTCITLRTLVLKDGVAYVQAGAGIVADSDPEAEYQETVNKAKGMIKAISVTEQVHLEEI